MARRHLKYPPPKRPLSRLETQHFNCGNYPMDPRPYEKLLADFGLLQDMKPGRSFPLSALLRESGTRAAPIWGEQYDWPGADHLAHFKRGRSPVAVLTQPYETVEVERLKLYAAARGLALHIPPNPFASFWFPGWTYCLLVTAPDFGPVSWLDEQLEFQTRQEPITA